MNDMKCPFCNGELVGTIGHPICRNQNCVMCDDPMPQDLLEELIRTRKALERIKKVVDGFGWGYGNMHLPDYHDGLIIAEIVNEALEQKE